MKHKQIAQRPPCDQRPQNPRRCHSGTGGHSPPSIPFRCTCIFLVPAFPQILAPPVGIGDHYRRQVGARSTRPFQPRLSPHPRAPFRHWRPLLSASRSSFHPTLSTSPIPRLAPTTPPSLRSTLPSVPMASVPDTLLVSPIRGIDLLDYGSSDEDCSESGGQLRRQPELASSGKSSSTGTPLGSNRPQPCSALALNANCREKGVSLFTDSTCTPPAEHPSPLCLPGDLTKIRLLSHRPGKASVKINAPAAITEVGECSKGAREIGRTEAHPPSMLLSKETDQPSVWVQKARLAASNRRTQPHSSSWILLNGNQDGSGEETFNGQGWHRVKPRYWWRTNPQTKDRRLPASLKDNTNKGQRQFGYNQFPSRHCFR